jgi:hypothetical protein
MSAPLIAPLIPSRARTDGREQVRSSRRSAASPAFAPTREPGQAARHDDVDALEAGKKLQQLTRPRHGFVASRDPMPDRLRLLLVRPDAAATGGRTGLGKLLCP